MVRYPRVGNSGSLAMSLLGLPGMREESRDQKPEVFGAVWCRLLQGSWTFCPEAKVALQGGSVEDKYLSPLPCPARAPTDQVQQKAVGVGACDGVHAGQHLGLRVG